MQLTVSGEAWEQEQKPAGYIVSIMMTPKNKANALVHSLSHPLLVQGLSPRNGAAHSQASLSLLSFTSLETPVCTHPEVSPTSFQLQPKQQWRWVMMSPPLANLILKYITFFKVNSKILRISYLSSIFISFCALALPTAGLPMPSNSLPNL